jgi:hypothetical protein
MADRAIFMGWNRPVPGREKRAAELFQNTLEYLGGLQSKGQIESFEPVIIGRHGGDMNGYIIIRAEADKLFTVKGDDTFYNFTIEASHLLDGFGVVDAYVGSGVMDIMSRWTKLIPK